MYREFGGKEQREKPRVREFREFGTASLQGITVYTTFANVWYKCPRSSKAFSYSIHLFEIDSFAS